MGAGLKSTPLFHSFADSEALVSALSGKVAGLLTTGIAQDGAASLVVSGGRTPVPLFQHLSHAPLDWSKVTITLADERWLEPDHPDSNEHLVRTHLLCNRAQQAQFVPLKNSAASAEKGQAQLAQALQSLAPIFTLVLLGMGEDGHIASLFPGASTLEIALDPHNHAPCQWIQPPGAGEYERLTLTLHRLLAAKKIFLHFSGEKKRALYQAVIEKTACRYPVNAIISQEQVPVEVYWNP